MKAIFSKQKIMKFWCRIIAAKRVLFMGKKRHWILISMDEDDLTHIIKCDFYPETGSKEIKMDTVLHGMVPYNLHQVCSTIAGSMTEDQRNQERLLYQAKSIVYKKRRVK